MEAAACINSGRVWHIFNFSWIAREQFWKETLQRKISRVATFEREQCKRAKRTWGSPARVPSIRLKQNDWAKDQQRKKIMGTGSYKDILLTSDGLQTYFLVKLNGKSVKVVILRNCIISHIGMEILAKKEACGILQLIRDLHFIGKLRKRASNKYNRDWEQKY